MTDNNNNIAKASFKNGLILGLFALVSTGLIALTHLLTKDRIASEVKAATARQLNQIIPPSAYDNDVYHDCLIVENKALLGSDEPTKVYRMRNQGEDVALFLNVTAPEGYSGKIKLIVGIKKGGSIAGVRVTEHKETPGLGDKIEISKSEWIRQFDQLTLNENDEQYWQVKKDGGQFDALTGATITPRAVIKAVRNSLSYFNANKKSLFESPTNCGIGE